MNKSIRQAESCCEPIGLKACAQIIAPVTALSDGAVGGATLGETEPLNTIKWLLDENYCTSKAERLADLLQ